MKCEQMPLEANGKRMALWYLCAERATEIKLFVKTFAESHNVKYGESERVSERARKSKQVEQNRLSDTTFYYYSPYRLYSQVKIENECLQ